jgi:hypothetical protein
MELRRKFNEFSAAAKNYIQVSHRRDAVEYTIAGIKKIHELNLELLGRDLVTLEMEDTMKDWVAETLFQGAYLREISPVGEGLQSLLSRDGVTKWRCCEIWTRTLHGPYPGHISFVFCSFANRNFRFD